MTSHDRRQRVFRRMLARDAGVDASAPAIAAATRRLSEHFARLLTPLLGDAGVAAILARALHLAQRHVPGRAQLRSPGPGNAPSIPEQQYLEQLEPAEALEAAVALLTAISALLVSFIGEGLTTRLLREAWPDDFADDRTEETIT